MNAAGVGEVGVGYHALLLRALASLDVGFFAEGLVLLLDCLLEIEVLLAALTCLVDDGLGFAVAAAAVDKKGVAALAGEYGRGLELFDRDFLLKACSSVRQTAAMGASVGALLPGAGTQPGNALALIIGRPMPAEGVGGRRRLWGGTGGGGAGGHRVTWFVAPAGRGRAAEGGWGGAPAHGGTHSVTRTRSSSRLARLAARR